MPVETRIYTPLQDYVERRLKDLVQKRKYASTELKENDWRLRLLDRAIYSTYVDCRELGLEEVAKKIIHLGEEMSSRNQEPQYASEMTKELRPAEKTR